MRYGRNSLKISWATQKWGAIPDAAATKYRSFFYSRAIAQRVKHVAWDTRKSPRQETKLPMPEC